MEDLLKAQPKWLGLLEDHFYSQRKFLQDMEAQERRRQHPVAHENGERAEGLSFCSLAGEYAVTVHNYQGPENQEPRRKYWATRSFVRSFARTGHSSVCSALLASLACSKIVGK